MDADMRVSSQVRQNIRYDTVSNVTETLQFDTPNIPHEQFVQKMAISIRLHTVIHQ